MNLIAIDAEARRELSAIELDAVVGGSSSRSGPGSVYEPPPPLRVENPPLLGGGGLLKNPHMRLF
jgi:hypothetical protein